MHAVILEIVDNSSPAAALSLARAAAREGSPVWDDQAWLHVATAAHSRAISDPDWFALSIFAHEQRTAEVAFIDAIMKRARCIVVQGAATHDPFRDPAALFERVRKFIAADGAAEALRAFQSAMDVVFTADRNSAEWEQARLQFLRGRRLRDIGRALRSVADRGVVVPDDLAEWLVWADVRELNGRVVV